VGKCGIIDFSLHFREPHKLSLVWSRRSRRVASVPMTWEPTLQNPYKGLVVWPVPENHQVAITLFKDPRTTELEDKEWSFIIEDVSYFILLTSIIVICSLTKETF
jgi:hypothetical protein